MHHAGGGGAEESWSNCKSFSTAQHRFARWKQHPPRVRRRRERVAPIPFLLASIPSRLSSHALLFRPRSPRPPQHAMFQTRASTGRQERSSRASASASRAGGRGFEGLLTMAPEARADGRGKRRMPEGKRKERTEKVCVCFGGRPGGASGHGSAGAAPHAMEGGREEGGQEREGREGRRDEGGREGGREEKKKGCAQRLSGCACARAVLCCA